MRQLLLNAVSFNFMIWEINPIKRNENNIVKIYIDENQSLSKGDCLIGEYGPESLSNHEVIEVIDRKKGSVKGKDYVTLLVKWSREIPSFSEHEMNVDARFKNLYNIR